jgi:hypothetical protein
MLYMISVLTFCSPAKGTALVRVVSFAGEQKEGAFVAVIYGKVSYSGLTEAIIKMGMHESVNCKEKSLLVENRPYFTGLA